MAVCLVWMVNNCLIARHSAHFWLQTHRAGMAFLRPKNLQKTPIPCLNLYTHCQSLCRATRCPRPYEVITGSVCIPMFRSIPSKHIITSMKRSVLTSIPGPRKWHSAIASHFSTVSLVSSVLSSLRPYHKLQMSYLWPQSPWRLPSG